MSRPDLAAAMTALPEQGVVLLQGVFSKDLLPPLRESADACFSRIAAGHTQELAAGYRFTPFSYSVLLAALLECGVASREELVAPLAVIGLNDLLADFRAGPVECSPAVCNLDESWVRKRFAPSNAPRLYHPNIWHQDGGLGVSYGLDRASLPPMTRRASPAGFPWRRVEKTAPGWNSSGIPWNACSTTRNCRTSTCANASRRTSFGRRNWNSATACCSSPAACIAPTCGRRWSATGSVWSIVFPPSQLIEGRCLRVVLGSYRTKLQST